MKSLIPLTAAIVALSLAAPAQADRGGKKHFRDGRHTSAWCPPGLAKKDNGCRPPGHARKDDRRHYDRWDGDDGWRYGDRRRHEGDRRIRVGGYVDDRFLWVDPYRYGFDPRYHYYRTADEVFRVDPETQQILALIGLVSALLR